MSGVFRTAGLALVLASAGKASVAGGATYDDVRSIIDATCAGPCHNVRGAGFFLPLTSLGEIRGNQAAMISAIEDDYMPMGQAPGFKTSAAGRALLDWLRNGADLQDPPAPAPPHILMRDPRELTYADVKPLIDRHCVGCHNPEGRMWRKPFNTLAGVQRYSDEMWRELDRGDMPQGDPEFRFSADARALMGWLRYASDSQAPRGEDDD